MLECKACGQINGDGSRYCSQCRAALKTPAPSAQNRFAGKSGHTEYAVRRTGVTAIKVLTVIMLIVGFVLIRVATAEQRAVQIAEKYVTEKVSDVWSANVRSVDFTSVVRAEEGEAFDGFYLLGTCTANDGNMSYQHKIAVHIVVRMEGIFDSGEVVSAYINGKKME